MGSDKNEITFTPTRRGSTLVTMSEKNKRTAEQAGLDNKRTEAQADHRELVDLASLTGVQNPDFEGKTVIVGDKLSANGRHIVTLVDFTHEGEMHTERQISVKRQNIDPWGGLLVFLTGLKNTDLNGALCILGKYCPKTQRHRVQKIEFTPNRSEFHFVGHELAIRAVNLVKEVRITKEDSRHHGKTALVQNYNPQTKLYELNVQYPTHLDIAPYTEDIIVDVSWEDFMFQEWIM